MNAKIKLHFYVDDDAADRFTYAIVDSQLLRCVLDEVIADYFGFENLFFSL